MLTLSVEPGYCMGNFRIGMPISEAIQYLKQYVDQMSRYPRSSELVMVQNSSTLSTSPSSSNGETYVPSFSIVSLDENRVNKVEILYNEKDPLNNDIIVKIVEEDIILYFESKSQRLKLIQINNVSKVKLSYGGIIFSGPNTDASFVNIYNVFGPTYPGEFESKSSTYILTYPGLTFVFPIPQMFAHLYEDGQELPIEFPNNTTPIATAIYLFHGHELKKPKLPPSKTDSAAQNPGNGVSHYTTVNSEISRNIERKNRQMKNKTEESKSTDYYFEPVQVILGKGILLTNRNRKIKFGYSTQDVLMIIGPPDKIYYKRNDKLRIHAIGAGQISNHLLDRMNGDGVAQPSDNFDRPITNLSNMLPPLSNRSRQGVGNDYFYNYFTMGFDIMFDGSSHTVQKIILHTNFPGSVDFNVYVKCNFSISVDQFEKENNSKENKGFIGPDEKFASIQKTLSKSQCSKPIVHDHTKANNPFGGTKFYAYKNCIFETMSRNDHINSVTLFKAES